MSTVTVAPVGSRVRLLLAAAAMLAASSAGAHGDAAGAATGFEAGFLHPLFGWDHVAAMVAVGLWGAVLGAPALWLLPVVFPLVMTLGGVLGVLGVPLPGVELAIALSALALGGSVAAAVRPPWPAAALLVGAFAVFHGHAHGMELPAAADPVAYSLGFVISTGLLHLGGVAFGLLTRWPAGTVAVRCAGGAIACAGVLFLRGAA